MSTYSAITGASQAQRSPEGPAPAPLLSHMRRKPGPKQSNLRTFTKDIKDCKIKQSRPNPLVGRGCRINRWMTNSQGGWSHPGRLSRQATFSCSPPAPAVCSQLYHLSPQPPFGSKAYSLGFRLDQTSTKGYLFPFSLCS